MRKSQALKNCYLEVSYTSSEYYLELVISFISPILTSWKLDPPLLYSQSFQVNIGNAYKLLIIMLYFSSVSSGNFVNQWCFQNTKQIFLTKYTQGKITQIISNMLTVLEKMFSSTSELRMKII